MKALIACLLLAGAFLGTLGGQAHASCPSMGAPTRALAAADAAFVGTVLERRTLPAFSGATAESTKTVWVFRVERKIKGVLASEIEVDALSHYPLGVEGQPAGLFLKRNGARWESDECQTIGPSALIRAAGPLPRPSGRGKAAFVLGGDFGKARLAALDSTGRLLAYGKGKGRTSQLSWCPGSKNLVELFDNGSNERSLAVRKVPSLALVRSVPLPQASRSPSLLQANALSCRDRSGRTSYVSLTNSNHTNGPVSNGMILRVEGSNASIVHEGSLNASVFSARQDVAFATGGQFGADILRIDLKSGSAETIANVGADTDGLSLSLDETKLAVLVSGQRVPGGAPARLVVIDLQARPPTTEELPLNRVFIGDQIVWTDSKTLALIPSATVLPGGRGSGANIRLGQYHLLRNFEGLPVRSPVVVGSRIYGLGQRGIQFTNPGSDKVKDLPDPAALHDALVLIASKH